MAHSWAGYQVAESYQSSAKPKVKKALSSSLCLRLLHTFLRENQSLDYRKKIVPYQILEEVIDICVFFCLLLLQIHFSAHFEAFCTLPFLTSSLANSQLTLFVCKPQRVGWDEFSVGNHISLALPIILKSLNHILFTWSISYCVSSFLLPGEVNGTWRWSLRGSSRRDNYLDIIICN